MFNRGVFSNLMGTGSAVVFLVVLAIMVMAVPSSFSLSADPLRVKVGSASNVQTGQSFSVSINLENDSALQISGFDLLLAYDADLATLVGAQLGQMLNDCAWEYFAYRTSPFDCNGDCPNGLVRVVALADLNNGSAYPDCFAESGGELVSLEFVAIADSSSGCQIDPVRFYWLDCGDNAIATMGGDSIYVARDVYYEDGVPTPASADTFPNYYGTPEHCLDSSHMGISRQIDFFGNKFEVNCPDTVTDTDHLRVKVERVYGVHIGQPFSVSINLENDSALQLGGFDFLLAYDANLATLTGAEQGQLLTDCGWEYFTYRTVPIDSCNGDCPSGLVRIVALAEIPDGPHHPNCFAEPGGELVSLEFLTTTDVTEECQFIPINFFWLDCGDNVMTTITGDSLYVSDDVFLEDWVPAPPPVDTFPNYSGTPEHCLDSSQGRISRRIDFWGNGADIYCADSIDQRGDINLNGIPYEAPDWILFTNYFLYGLEVFTVDPEMQIAASDCNWDGLTLTLPDLVYLGWIVVGDSLPNPSPPVPTRSADTVLLIQDTIAHTLSVYFADSLTALYLIFTGEVVPSFDLSYHNEDVFFDSVSTRVLVSPYLAFSFPNLPLIDTGLIFSYTGNGQLAEAYAARDGFNSILTIIQGSSVPDCCELRGDVNGNGQIDVADLTYLVDYLFSGGPAPLCLQEADLNGQSGMVDASDLVYLVDYLFRGGQQPVPCP